VKEDLHELVDGYRAGVSISTRNALFYKENPLVSLFIPRMISLNEGISGEISILFTMPSHFDQI